MGFTKDIIGTNESVGGINLFESVKSTQLATDSTAGLMSATDKSKLDSLENYVHPDSGVVPGKYMQVDVNEQGHVVAGRELQNSTLEDYRIKDAYIDLSDNSIVLGSHRLKPITPSDKVRWEQIVDTPNTLKEFGVTDVALSDGTINIGGDLITPLTADSQIAADKIAGVIDLKNIPVGAMERCVVVEDDAARFALTTNDVQKGDTVKVTNPTPTMYMVVDESKLDSADGYVMYSAGNANSVPWGGITDKPDQFYTLPKADTNTLGGVIIGDNITVDADGKISTHSPYSLPQASDTVLGGVKIGENILEQPDGTINISTATTNAPGVVKIGDNINIDDDGTISTEKYQLPTATNMRLGGVRIGKYLSVDSEGLLNATGVPIAASKTDMGGVIIGENIDIDENGKISVTLPTKTSELENDSEFITTENLSLHNNDENAHASKFEAMHGQFVNVYNNVAEMKQSTRLKVGMAAKTLGYYSTNDGGGAYYVIRAKQDNDVDDGGSIHELANGLVAELVVAPKTHITDILYGTYNNACIANFNYENKPAAVLGLQNRYVWSIYPGRDIVGIYSGIAAPTSITVDGSDFDVHHVTLSEIPDLLKVGMIIDVHKTAGFNEATKYSGIVTGINKETKVITVEYWVKVGNDSTGQYPDENYSKCVINPVTKIWGQNTNVYVNHDKNTRLTGSCCHEYGIWNSLANAQCDGITMVLFTGPGNAAFSAEKSSSNENFFKYGFRDVKSSKVSFFSNTPSSMSFWSRRAGKESLKIENDLDSNAKAVTIGEADKAIRLFQMDSVGRIEKQIFKWKKITATTSLTDDYRYTIICTDNINLTLPITPPYENTEYTILSITSTGNINLKSNTTIYYKNSNGIQASGNLVTLNIPHTILKAIYINSAWYLFY